MVHEAGFRIDRSDGTLMFIEPGGDAIEDAPPASRPQRADLFSPRTNRPRMLQRLDLGAAVEGLVVRAGLHDSGLHQRTTSSARRGC